MSRVLITLALAFTTASSAPIRAADKDFIEGTWSGVVGKPEDQVAIAFEFRRAADGKLATFYYQPIVNTYAMALPEIKVEANAYSIDALSLSLTRVDDRLEGTLSSLKLPIKLSRTDKLPAEAPMPDVPRGPEPRWRTKLGGSIYATSAVRDGIAYVGTTGGVFQAVNVRDGAFVWTFAAGRPMFGEALVTDDRVYFVCDNGYLFALNRRDGKEVWRYDLGDARIARVLQHQAVFDYDLGAPRPVSADGVIYVGSGDGSVHAVDMQNGTRRWRFETAGKIRASALIDGTSVIAGSLDGKVYALDRSDGHQVWQRDLRAPVTSTPARIGHRIAVGTRGAVLYGLTPATGEIDWRVMFWGSWVESEAVERDGKLYIGSSDLRRVSAIDPNDGRVLWRSDVYGFTWGRPVVTDKVIYAGAGGSSPYMIKHVGGLVALDRASGAVKWRWPFPEMQGDLSTGFAAGPALSGTTLVIGGMDGTLYGFSVD